MSGDLTTSNLRPATVEYLETQMAPCSSCSRSSILAAVDGGLCLRCAMGFSRLTPGQRRFVRLVEGLTYREGWTFRTHYSDEVHPVVIVEWAVPDLYAPDRVSILRRFISLDPLAYHVVEEDAVRRGLMELWLAIDALEGHERMELLRSGGKQIWPPHPNGPDDPELRSRPTFSERLP